MGRSGHPRDRRQPVRPDRRANDPLAAAGRAIDAHPALARAFLRFLQVDERRILRQRGTHEPEAIADGPPASAPARSDVVASLAAAGVEHLGAVDLHVQTGTGERVVRVEPGVHVYGTPTGDEPTADAKPGMAPTHGRHWRMRGPGVARGRAVARTASTS